MSSRTKNKSWRITIFIQERREILGDVEAATREALKRLP
jgi:hypothetical protein